LIFKSQLTKDTFGIVEEIISKSQSIRRKKKNLDLQVLSLFLSYVKMMDEASIQTCNQHSY